MKHLFRALFILLLFGSCNTATPDPSIFNSSNLPSQFVRINTDRDTALHLAGGTIITIPAHSLEAAQGTIVKLEIKEAIAIEDIITAGLYTESNGQALRSAGMIYINPVGETKVRILKPLQVKIPTNDISDKMMLFKGEEKDGRINWVAPQPLPAKPNTVNVAAGKIMFQQNCAPCHGIEKKLTGPALYGTMQRWKHDTAAVYRFTKNSAAVLASGNAYACCVYNSYNKLAMTAFPTLSDKDLEAIYHFIDQEGQKKLGGVPEELATSECNDCPARSMPMPATDYNYSAESDSIEMASSPYYAIAINNFGWSNLDLFFEETGNIKPSKIDIHIKGQQKDEYTSLSLIIPYYKVFQYGWALNDEKNMGCFDPGEVMLLPEGATAYVMAIGTRDLSYGITKFTIARQQSVTIALQPAGKQAILKSIKTFQLPANIPDVITTEFTPEKPDTTAVRYSRLDSLCSCYSELK